MKNFQRDGNVAELTAPGGGVVSGTGYVIGSIFVVATFSAAAAAKFTGARRGVFRLPKHTSDAVAEGGKAYWDDSAKLVRAASATGRFVIGTIEKAQLAADTYCDVCLDEVAVTAIP